MNAKARKIIFNKRFRENFKWWDRKDKAKAEKILDLIESVTEDPFRGLGKPEPLKHIASSAWSRIITAEHKLVYRVTDIFIEFLQARYHY